jgi:ABC-type lipoprotein release transport system permease subunit
VIDPDSAITGAGRKLREEDLVRRVYTQQELNDGVVLNAAVMLEDPSRIDETMEKIKAVSASEGLNLNVVSWQKASGILGQLINVFRVLLFLAVAAIFFAAMVIMYLSVLMATLQRTQMFGTMRAIGAQRGLVLSMVLLESIVLGVIFGGLGMLLGTGVLAAIGAHGIAAPNDVMYFFFSGPRLVPHVSTWPLVVAIVIVLVVTIGSTLVPALMATRVSPLRAMQADE